MKKKILKFSFFIKKNIEIIVLIFFIILLIIVTQSYNSIKNAKKKNFYSILNNIYFEKTVNFYFESLSPKYLNINHKIKSGETLDKILNKHKISKKEIQNIKKELIKTSKIKNLKIGHTIEFILDKSEDKIIEFIFPLSRTTKIKLTRTSNKDLFETKKIVKNLIKKTVIKEGKILQSLYKR